MKKKKLLILFWDLDIGGIQTIIRDLVVYLNDSYPNVDVSILLRNKTDSQILRDIQRKTRATIYIANDRGNIRFINRTYFLVWLIGLYRKLKPDIFLTFLGTLSIIAIMVRKLFFWRKTRVVLNEGIITSKYNAMNTRAVWLWNLLISIFYKQADCIIVPSAACKKDLISHFFIPDTKIRIGRNWTLLQKRPSLKQVYDLVYVGRLAKEKKISNLITIMKFLQKKYPRITLCLVGKGTEEQHLKKLVVESRLQNNVIFAGYNSDIIPYLNKSKIFVMTTQNEGLPVALLEAGSQGLPSVVTRFAGSNEVIMNGKTGYIANSVQNAYRYISTLLQDVNLRKKFGMKAQKFVQSQYGEKNVKLFIRYLLDV